MQPTFPTMIFFSFGFLHLLIEIDAGNALLLGILHGLPCATALALDAKHNQIRSVHHGPVSGLVGIFVVAHGSSFTYFDFIVIVPEGFFVVPELCGEIGQNQNMCAVVAAVFLLTAAYCGGNDLVKLSISPNQELDIFVFPHQCSYELFQPIFNF